MIVPAVVTNIWQTFVGSYLRDIIRRLWPLLGITVDNLCTIAGDNVPDVRKQLCIRMRSCG